MQRGYLLHTSAYRENSQIVRLLVDNLGRVDAVVRIGSGKRSLKSVLQPFQPLLFELSGRSDLRSMQQVESASPAVPLSGDALYAGMYLNELMMRTLSVHHSGESLFLPYHRTLLQLAHGFTEDTLRYFEVTLMHDLGCLPSLSHDANGQPIEAELSYRYLTEEGFIVGEGRYSGSVLQRLAHESLLVEDLPVAKHLTRTLLAPLLGDKPLVSRQLFAGRKR
ncbi:DNA recombination protein RecO [Shewanella mangrovi]|uniref:DNA repair protein RecO n=1 Tax=Shewanella mangrovi TaxID=1515746 RepID=A0A094JGI7_9GAMM|nr:DNA repair protein RecO [Shewanella mangrovi]KFZ38312.1 DNA recombination protein RecO [Shewanella mangrovi]